MFLYSITQTQSTNSTHQILVICAVPLNTWTRKIQSHPLLMSFLSQWQEPDSQILLILLQPIPPRCTAWQENDLTASTLPHTISYLVKCARSELTDNQLSFSENDIPQPTQKLKCNKSDTVLPHLHGLERQWDSLSHFRYLVSEDQQFLTAFSRVAWLKSLLSCKKISLLISLSVFFFHLPFVTYPF